MDERVAETIAGYARAAEFLEKERRERLASLTPEESRAIFDELVASGDSMPIGDEEAERLLRWRLETKIAARQAFIQLARAKGLL
jgi:hypothetical protein